MKIRILQVFYGADNLPYKDQARTVHYPITGNGFQNANNTTQIRFYFSQLSGENTTWVAVSKLPNGKVGSKVLETYIDDELNEPYALLELDSYYTQYKGEVFISLQGYQGGVKVTYNEETKIYEISGTPTIAATGSVKFTNNYAPSFVGSGQEQNITIQQLLGYLSSKADIGNTIYIVADIESEDLSGYEDGQVIYDLFSDLYYEVNSQVQKGYEPANGNGLLGNKGALIRFFGLTDTITLQQIYDLIGANRYASLNVDGIEYLVIMSVNNSIKAYDLLEKKLYDYTDAPQDTFADVLNETPITFVEHTQQANRVYGTNQFAQETTIPYSVNVVNNGIVQRGSDGQINVPTNPAYAYNAASKNYVDSNYGKKVQLTIDNDTFVITVKLLNNNDVVISQANVDLPLESIVVSAQYYDTYTYQGVTYTKVLVIVLATTDNPIIAPVGDLVSGLVSETTFNNAVAQLQTNINKCVQQTNTANVVYGTNNVGTQTTIRYGTSISANGLVQRDALGQINVSATPSSNSNATSKQYVDTFGRTLEFSIDNSTYVMTFKLKDNNGNVISTQTIDLPLETMVVDGYYDSENESLVLELKNGNKITIPISDLISGLVTETSLATTLQSYYTKAQIDQMVAGFVFADVDDYLSDSSTNPVENRVITNALETKANVDGNYQTMTVGLANNLDTKLEQNDDSAYLFRTAGGSLEIGDFCKEKAIVGGSLGFNQLIKGDFSSGVPSGWFTERGSLSNSGNIAVLSPTSGDSYSEFTIKTVAGHKYMALASLKCNQNGGRIRCYAYYDNLSFYKMSADIDTDTWTFVGLVFSASVDANNSIFRFINPSDMYTEGYTYSFKAPMIIDLTAMFGSTIADYIYNLEQANAGAGVAWFRKYFNKPYYPYTAIGGFTSVKTSGKKVVGFNQWDEVVELGWITHTTGKNSASSDCLRSKNYIKVLPETVYYIKSPTNITFRYYDANKNFIGIKDYNGIEDGYDITRKMPSNAAYLRFVIYQDYGTTYKNDVCINFHYDGERDGEYEPYKSETYPNDNIELIGIPHIDKSGNLYFDGNRYLPSGEVEEKWTKVDNITTYTQTPYANRKGDLVAVIATGGKKVSNVNVANFSNSIGAKIVSGDVQYLSSFDNVALAQTSNGYITLCVKGITTISDLTSWLVAHPISVVYEKESPTTSQATSYPETQQVDNWGTEQYLPPESDTRPCEVPVGHDTDYLLDLKSKLEIMPDSPSADGDYVVHSESGVNTYVALGAWLSSNGWIKLTDISGYDAEKTQTLKNVNGTLTWVDD